MASLLLVPPVVALAMVHAPAPPAWTPRSRPAGLPLATLLPRRQALLHALGGGAGLLLSLPASSFASELAERVDAEYAYRLAYPSDWSDASKPVRTHLHELLLSAPAGEARMKLGVTVDPVKIDSLEAFGNLDQARARARPQNARIYRWLPTLLCWRCAAASPRRSRSACSVSRRRETESRA